MEPVQQSYIPGKQISVVMATYNGALYIEEQLASILAQTLTPTEIIICDDLSTDSTVSILERLAKQDVSIKYFVNEQRLGVIENFKKAVSLTSGIGYIALADQDDIWMPDKLEKLCKILSHIDTGQLPAMVYSDLIVINSEGHVVNNSFWNELGQDGYTHCFETLLFGNFVTGCTILMNEHMKKHFAEMPPHVLMHDAWIALIAFSFGKVTTIREPLVKYRRHNTNAAFLPTYRKRNIVKKLTDHVRLLFTKNNYLADQFQLVQLFMDAYENLLTEKQAARVALFLSLQNRSYLRKKIMFRSFFKEHWLR